jgi:outer membrane protein assembly factor BamB
MPRVISVTFSKSAVMRLLVNIGLFFGAAAAIPAFSQIPGILRWKFTPAALGTWSGASVGPDGTVYVCLCERTGGGAVYALDGASGSVKWQFRSSCFSSTPAVGDNGIVYVGGGDNQVRALNAADGTVLWSYSGATSAFEASPALGSGGAVFIGCNDKKLYAFEGVSGTKRWTFTTGGQIHEAPAIAINGTVYTGSADGKLYALDSLTGSNKWTFATAGSIVCSPAIGADGTVYFGSSDHKVYAVNGATGKEIWEYLTAAAVDWSPALADDMVVIGSNDGTMYSLEADTGEVCWSLPLLTPYSRLHPTFGTDGNLYFGGPGWFTALDHITKIPAWLYTTPTTNNLTGVIGADGTVYFGSDGGSFYAVWSTSLGGFGQSPWPAAGQNVRHNGLAPTRPKILNQPGNQVIRLGGAATLTAIAVGRPPLTLQWMFNGVQISGATNIALILTNLQATQLGDYTLAITNSFGSATSAPATLSLDLAPTITLQPLNQIVPLGGSAHFSVAATGALPLAYQWQVNTTNLAGATQPDLLLTNVGPQNAGVYRALVTNDTATATSSGAALLVVMPAALALQPGGLMSLTGTIGGTYRLESTHLLGNPNWVALTNLTMLTNPVSFSAGSLTNFQETFYRAIIAQ